MVALEGMKKKDKLEKLFKIIVILSFCKHYINRANSNKLGLPPIDMVYETLKFESLQIERNSILLS